MKTCLNLTEVPSQLSNKGIEEFFEGNDVMFARSESKEIYSWGRDSNGRLARLSIHQKGENEPEEVKFFSGKSSIQISFGSWHCLALSAKGLIYGWGYIGEGQVGCGQSGNELHFPVLIVSKYGIENRIKFITSSISISFAADVNGHAYYWVLKKFKRDS